MSPYILLAIVIAFTTALSFGGLQTYRLQGLHATYDAHLAADQIAVSDAQAKAEKAATDAITGVHDAQAKNAAAVKSAVAHVLRQCAHASPMQPAASAAGADAATGKTPDLETSDDGFADELAADIGTCSDELDRFAGLQEWARNVTKP